MTRKLFSLGAGVVLAASLAAPASAQPLCVGTQETFVQCVDPTGGAPIEDCVYVGKPPCVPVSVPTPHFYCIGGDMGERLFNCDK
jgi:hypothetical protein